MMSGYLHKASDFEYRLCHKSFSGKVRAWIIEINCTDDDYFNCYRVYTQNKMLKGDILVAFDRENVSWEMVYNFPGIDEKT